MWVYGTWIRHTDDGGLHWGDTSRYSGTLGGYGPIAKVDLIPKTITFFIIARGLMNVSCIAISMTIQQNMVNLSILERSAQTSWSRKTIIK